jgi:hypothetical protein
MRARRHENTKNAIIVRACVRAAQQQQCWCHLPRGPRDGGLSKVLKEELVSSRCLIDHLGVKWCRLVMLHVPTPTDHGTSDCGCNARRKRNTRHAIRFCEKLFAAISHQA